MVRSDRVVLADDLPHAAFHVAHRGAAQGRELPVEGAIERVGHEVRVGRHGAPQRRLAVVDAVFSVERVQRRQMQPVRPLLATAGATPNRVLQHGERDVVLALRQRLVRRLQVDATGATEHHASRYHDMSCRTRYVPHSPGRPRLPPSRGAVGARPNAAARAMARQSVSTAIVPVPGSTAGTARWNDSTVSRCGKWCMKVTTDSACVR